MNAIQNREKPTLLNICATQLTQFFSEILSFFVLGHLFAVFWPSNTKGGPVRLYAYERNDSNPSEQKKQTTLKTTLKTTSGVGDQRKILAKIISAKRPEKLSFCPVIKRSEKAETL